MTTSADLGILYIAGQQAQPEITHNTALNQLQILQTGVISVALNTPPGSPAQGDSYILGASPTGAWAGRANCLAGYFGTAWVFVPGVDSSGTPITMGVRHEGLKVYSKADNGLYIWSGSAWSAFTSGMTNPMTTSQDLIVGGASGTPGRLAIGTNGFVLTAVAGAVAWAAATGFANPMTTSGDIIYGGASGVATRLAAGTNGHVLTLAAGVPSWAANSAMANPMTTAGDLILGGASGVPGRLAIGTNGYVLTVVGGTAAWAAAAAGMTNPMTTSGDIIYGGASGTPTRLAAGSNGQVLTLAAGVPSWAAGGGSQVGVASKIASGDYYLTQSHAGSWTNASFATTSAYFSLAYVDADITISALSIAVFASAASSSVDVGLYQFLGNGKPGTCLASGTATTTTTGVKDITLGSPLLVTAGVYFLMLHANNGSVTLAAASFSSIGGDRDTSILLSDGFARLNQSSASASYTVADSGLPGGSYSVGMNLTGLTISTSNASTTGAIRRVAFKKN